MNATVPQQIVPGVHLFTVGQSAAASNVYLIGSGPQWVLVDTEWACR